MQQDSPQSQLHPVEPEERAPVKKQQPGSRRRIAFVVLGLIAVAGLTWAYRQWSFGRVHESTDNAAIDGHLIPVLAKVSGYIERVTAQENAHVTSDSLLVQIDPSEYKVRLSQAEADLAAAQVAVSTRQTTGQAEAQLESAAGQRASLNAQIDAARANAQKAHADLARYRDLAAKAIVSKQQLDAAQAAVESADANVVAVERQAAAAGATETGAQAGVRLAQARLNAARAARDNASLQLSYTRVVAPAAGIVSRRQAEVGQLVQAGQPLLTIVADTGLFVNANMKETQLADICVGQTADIDVDAYGGKSAKGVVESVAGATGSKFALLPPDNSTGNFTKVVQRIPVRIRITQGLGEDRPLRPGMSVTVHVNTKSCPPGGKQEVVGR